MNSMFILNTVRR